MMSDIGGMFERGSCGECTFWFVKTDLNWQIRFNMLSDSSLLLLVNDGVPILSTFIPFM